jgi:hypothetical protein
MDEMLSAWAGVVIVMGTAVLVTLAAMVWILFFRKNAHHHRRRRQHSDQCQPNPTLAQIGGLPPARRDDKLSEEQPTPTLISRL